MNQLFFSSARPLGFPVRLLALASVAATVQRARKRLRKAAESSPPAASSGTAAKAAVPAAAAPRKRPRKAAKSPPHAVSSGTDAKDAVAVASSTATKPRKRPRKAAESSHPAASSAVSKAGKQRRKAAEGKGLSSLGQKDKYLLLKEVAGMPPTAACDYVGLRGDRMSEEVWQLLQLPQEKLREMRDELRPTGDCRPDPLPGKVEYLWLCYDPNQQSHPPTPGREPLEIDEENDDLIIGFATRPVPRQEQRKLRDFRDEFAARPDSRDHKERLMTVQRCLENANARKTAGKEPEIFWPLGGGNSFPLGDGDRLWARSTGHWHCVVDAYMNAIHALGGMPKARFRNKLRKKFGGNCPLTALLGIKLFSRQGVVYALRPLNHVSWYSLTSGTKLKGVFLVGGAHHCICVDRSRRKILNAASHFEMALTQKNLAACCVWDGPIEVMCVTAVQPIEVL